MAKEKLALSIDFGTQSVRALIFDKTGELLIKTKHIYETPYFSMKDGYAEQYPEYYFECMVKALVEMREKVPELLELVGGMSITCMRDTCVCLDKNVKPLRPAILWLDQRESSDEINKAQLPKSRKIIYKLVKMYKPALKQMAKSSCNWIKQNEKEIWSKTDKFVMISCYINYLLTGKLIDSVASQIGHIPFNYKSKTWMNPHDMNYYVWDIPREKLCEIIEPGDVVGKITKSVAERTGLKEGLTVYAAGSDKGCETIGSGCMDEETASISFGTAATIQMTSKKYFEPLLFMPSYTAVLKGCFNPEIQIYRGYWMISWFKNQFAHSEAALAKNTGVTPESILDKTLAEVPAGCCGLVLQPYWSPTLKEPDGKGAIIGFSDTHTKEYLYRAIIEGIGFGLLDGLKNMEKRGNIKAKKITVNGGGSGSDMICQITADMFGVSVLRAQTYETSGLGAAIVTFYGMGVYDNMETAIKNMVRHVDCFSPNMETNKLYENIYKKIYCKLFTRLKPLYSEMKKVQHELGLI